MRKERGQGGCRFWTTLREISTAWTQRAPLRCSSLKTRAWCGAEPVEGRRVHHLKEAGRAYVEERGKELTAAHDAVTAEVGGMAGCAARPVPPRVNPC